MGETRCVCHMVGPADCLVHSEQLAADARLGAALRAALAKLSVGESLHIDEQETDGNRVWHMSGPYSKRTDATRALAAALSQTGDTNEPTG